jgi:hypothetical protein
MSQYDADGFKLSCCDKVTPILQPQLIISDTRQIAFCKLCQHESKILQLVVQELGTYFAHCQFEWSELVCGTLISIHLGLTLMRRNYIAHSSRAVKINKYDAEKGNQRAVSSLFIIITIIAIISMTAMSLRAPVYVRLNNWTNGEQVARPVTRTCRSCFKESSILRLCMA